MMPREQRLHALASELAEAGFYRYLPEDYEPYARKLIANDGLVYVLEHRRKVWASTPAALVTELLKLFAENGFAQASSLRVETKDRCQCVALGETLLWDPTVLPPGAEYEEWADGFTPRLCVAVNEELAKAGIDERIFPMFPQAGSLMLLTERAYALLHGHPDIDQGLLPLRADPATVALGLYEMARATAHPWAYYKHRVFWVPSEGDFTDGGIPAAVQERLRAKGLTVVRYYANQAGQALLLCHHQEGKENAVNYLVVAGGTSNEKYPPLACLNRGNHGFEMGLTPSGRLLEGRYLIVLADGMDLVDLETMEVCDRRVPFAHGYQGVHDVDPEGKLIYFLFYLDDSEFPFIGARAFASGESIHFDRDGLTNPGIRDASFHFDAGRVYVLANRADGSPMPPLLLDSKTLP